MKLLLFLISLILISSCTVTKRVHLNGYYVEWNKPFCRQNATTDEASTQVFKQYEMRQKQEVDVSEKNNEPQTMFILNQTEAPSKVNAHEIPESNIVEEQFSPPDSIKKTRSVRTKKDETTNSTPKLKRRIPLGLSIPLLVIYLPAGILGLLIGLYVIGIAEVGVWFTAVGLFLWLVVTILFLYTLLLLADDMNSKFETKKERNKSLFKSSCLTISIIAGVFLLIGLIGLIVQ